MSECSLDVSDCLSLKHIGFPFFLSFVSKQLSEILSCRVSIIQYCPIPIHLHWLVAEVFAS